MWQASQRSITKSIPPISINAGRRFHGLLLLLSSLATLTLQAAVHHIDPSTPIQEPGGFARVLAEAKSGDEINLQRGIHTIKPAYPAGHATAPLQLLNKTNLTIRGAENGVEVFSDGPGEMLLLSQCSGIRFENITFRGNNAPVENGNWLYSIIMLYNKNEKLTFERCQFLNFGNHAISQLYGIKQTTDVTIRNCRFADGGDLVVADGAAVSGIGSRWLLESNRVERCLYGFEIEGPWGTNQNITIRHNTFIEPRGCGVVIFPTSGRSSDFSDIDISDNSFKDARRHPSRPGVFPVALFVGGGERIRIRRNVIENSETGIAVAATWSDLRDVFIDSNTITNSGFNGIRTDQFGTFKASNVLIRSNRVTLAGLSGIAVTGANIRVQGNSVENCGWVGVYGGIEALGDTTNVQFYGNIARNRGTTFQDYGIRVATTVRNAEIGPNLFRHLKLAAIHDEGASTILKTHIVNTTMPTWELGSTVNIFDMPESHGQVQTSWNLKDWTGVYNYTVDENGEASVLVTPDMILVGYRYYRAMRQ